jgi:hypothetical protein
MVPTPESNYSNMTGGEWALLAVVITIGFIAICILKFTGQI